MEKSEIEQVPFAEQMIGVPGKFGLQLFLNPGRENSLDVRDVQLGLCFKLVQLFPEQSGGHVF